MQYDGACDFSEGLAIVEMNGKIGFVDKNVNEVIPCEYDDDSRCFYEGLALVKKNGCRFYIDKTGNEYIKE